MEKDVFKFKDFMTGDNPDLENKINNLIKEGFFDDVEDEDSTEDEEINQDFNPYKVPSSEIEDEKDDIHLQHRNMSLDDENLEFDFVDEDEFNEVDEDDNEELEDLDESKSESEDYYKLFKDKAEDFVCDIAVEGVNQNDTEVRLIIESEDWTLMFVGEIKKGKCIIPIKKLNIFNEGQTGNIKLEVNADGNLFTPWEDKFVVKVSKKVTVKLNESKSSKTTKAPVKKGLGVKVNVRK
jgi:hypothetical protein